MSKERPQLQGVLALDGPLAATEDNGSYLNEEQLDAVETAIANNATALQTAADAQQQAEDNLADAQQENTDLTTQVNTLAEAAGVESGDTVADTITAIENKIEELGKEPGAAHTNAAGGSGNESDTHEYVDLNTPFYQKTKELLN